MVLPNFLGIGVGKAGTTSLHYVLQQHPDVLMVPEKEAHFFNSDLHYALGNEWYASKFSAHKGQPFVGDITPAYFLFPDTYQRMIECCGSDVKLILVLRHPVTRAYSHYLHGVRLLETNEPFLHEDVILQSIADFEPDRFCDKTYINASTYPERLQRLLDAFPRQNILVLIYERDIAHGMLSSGYRKIAKHLGLTDHPIDFDIHKVKAFIPRITYMKGNADIQRFPELADVEMGDVIIETVRNSDSGLQPELLKQPSPEKLAWLADFEANITRILPNERIRELTERYFASDIAATRALLGDSITEWDI